MGGQDSVYYVQFRMYACEAYNILRKSADLILSLFHLMAGASIDAIRQDPEKAILKLQVRWGAGQQGSVGGKAGWWARGHAGGRVVWRGGGRGRQVGG